MVLGGATVSIKDHSDQEMLATHGHHKPEVALGDVLGINSKCRASLVLTSRSLMMMMRRLKSLTKDTSYDVGKIREALLDRYRQYLIFLHSFSGCDTVLAISGLRNCLRLQELQHSTLRGHISRPEIGYCYKIHHWMSLSMDGNKENKVMHQSLQQIPLHWTTF
ncbi:unnamed protein product [Leuciscus chuanchicus]